MAKRKNKTQTRKDVLSLLEYAQKHDKSPLLVVNCENINPEDKALVSEMIILLDGLERTQMPIVFLINSIQDPLVEAMKNRGCPKFMAVKPTEDFKEQIYKAANFYLTPTSTQNDIRDIKAACKYAIVPITHTALEGLKDYDPVKENGNSFTFKNINAWEMYGALVRALETFRFPYDWQNIVKEAQKLIDVLV